MPATRWEFSGRAFSTAEMNLILAIAREFSDLSLTELSKTLCELLDWKRPTGKLKYEECRGFLEHLRDQGIINLPGLHATCPAGPRRIAATTESDAQDPITGSAGEFEPLVLHQVRGQDRKLNSLFKEYIDRYHYLHYRIPFGGNLRYLVGSDRLTGRYLACLQFSSPAWTMAPRDAWIGWDGQQRKRNLQFIVNQSRFLVLPWVQVKGLASMILGLAARRLPEDWQGLYGYRPLLLETLVDTSRYRGTCYKAANWIYLGVTQGRGRMDRDNVARQALKDIYVYPLCRHVQEKLCSAVPPVFEEQDTE